MWKNRAIIGFCSIIALAFCFALLPSKKAFAGAWVDDGGGVVVSGGGTEDCNRTSNSTWGNCLGIGWVKYEYKTSELKSHGTVKIPNASSSNIHVEGNKISSKCGKYGFFYNLGYIVNRRWKDGSVIRAKPVDSEPFQLGSFTYAGNSWRNTYPGDNQTKKIDKDSGLRTTDGTKVWAVEYVGKDIAKKKFKQMASRHGEDLGITNKDFKDVASFCYGNSSDDGEFKSRSKVSWTDPETGDDKEKISKFDGVPEKENKKPKPAATITIPANQSSKTVVFRHYIYFPNDDDTSDEREQRYKDFKEADPKTKWKIEQSEYQPNKKVESGTLKMSQMTDSTKIDDKYYQQPDLKNDDGETVHRVVYSKVKVEVPVGGEEMVCQNISYDGKKFRISTNEDDKFKVTNQEGEGKSGICIKIVRLGTEPNSDHASFYSNSSVVDQTTRNDELKTTPVKTIELNFNQSTQTVTFAHKISSAVSDGVFTKAKKADASTTYTIYQANHNDFSRYNNSNIIQSGTVLPIGNLTKSGSVYTKTVYSKPVTVSVPKNTTVRVCQKIKYSTKNFDITSNGTFKPSNDSAESGICVDIHRPDQPVYPRQCPISNYYHTINYGNTVAETKVQDYTKGTGWVDEVLAKPSDEIQFRHRLCFGAQAVTSSGNDYGTYRRTAAQLSEFPANAFYLSGGRTNDYLFDRSDLASYHEILPKASAKPDSYYNNTSNFRIKPEETYVDYGLGFYSPANPDVSGVAGYDTRDWHCSIYDALSGWLAYGTSNTYRLPGFNWGRCRSANLAVNNSDVGHEVSQTLHYLDVEAWISHKHDKSSASCGGCGSYSDRESVCRYNDSTGNANCSYTAPYSRPIDLRYLSSVPDAYNNRSWGIWGYLRQDCKSEYCESSGVQYNSSWSTSKDSDGNENTTYNYWATLHTCPAGTTSYGLGSYSGGKNGHDYGSWYCSLNWKYLQDTKYNSPWNPGSSSTYHANITSDWREQNAIVKVPYNFRTEATASISTGSGSVIYAGENVESSFAITVKARQNPAVSSGEYLTITPRDTKVQFISFTVDNSISASAAEDLIKGGVIPRGYDLRSYFAGRFSSANFANPHILYNRDGEVNGDGKLTGQVIVASESSEPVQDVEPGSKYCVVAGISHADSHDRPDELVLPNNKSIAANYESMYNASPRWRVSNVVCRTIAKKPNVQVWGGLYAQGKVATTSSKKEAINRLFGSWSDVLAIAGKSMTGFASGATLGYIGNQGGANPASKSYCDLIPMSISNSGCSIINRVSGNAGTVAGVTTDKILNRIRSRYTPKQENKTPQSGYNIASRPAQLLNDGAVQYTYTNSNANTGPLTQLTGTRVIEVNGTLTIDHNICAGSGTCTYESNELRLRDRNNKQYGDGTGIGVADIPQVIIIAKNVKVEPNVTQVDAWIFSEDEVNTCTAGHSDTETCNKTIIFNGPIFAKRLTLNRTAGAYPGPNAIGAASIHEDLASAGRQYVHNVDVDTNVQYGSLTPGEIFNLRPDAYYWAYNQSNRLTQATVVYMRELAPRY